MGRLLQLVAVAIAARAAMSLARQYLDSGRESPRVGSDPDSAGKMVHRGKMVRDPQCGVHIPKNQAIALADSDQGPFFCSTECRDLYQKAT